MCPHRPPEENEHNRQQLFDASACFRNTEIEEGGQDDGADADRRALAGGVQPTKDVRQPQEPKGAGERENQPN